MDRGKDRGMDRERDRGRDRERDGEGEGEGEIHIHPHVPPVRITSCSEGRCLGLLARNDHPDSSPGNKTNVVVEGRAHPVAHAHRSVLQLRTDKGKVAAEAVKLLGIWVEAAQNALRGHTELQTSPGDR